MQLEQFSLEPFPRSQFSRCKGGTVQPSGSCIQTEYCKALDVVLKPGSIDPELIILQLIILQQIILQLMITQLIFPRLIHANTLLPL
ncbi:hypothetical protein D3C81_1710470 [compost metagenome]